MIMKKVIVWIAAALLGLWGCLSVLPPVRAETGTLYNVDPFEEEKEYGTAENNYDVTVYFNTSVTDLSAFPPVDSGYSFLAFGNGSGLDYNLYYLTCEEFLVAVMGWMMVYVEAGLCTEDEALAAIDVYDEIFSDLECLVLCQNDVMYDDLKCLFFENSASLLYLSRSFTVTASQVEALGELLVVDNLRPVNYPAGWRASSCTVTGQYGGPHTVSFCGGVVNFNTFASLSPWSETPGGTTEPEDPEPEDPLVPAVNDFVYGLFVENESLFDDLFEDENSFGQLVAGYYIDQESETLYQFSIEYQVFSGNGQIIKAVHLDLDSQTGNTQTDLGRYFIYITPDSDASAGTGLLTEFVPLMRGMYIQNIGTQPAAACFRLLPTGADLNDAASRNDLFEMVYQAFEDDRWNAAFNAGHDQGYEAGFDAGEISGYEEGQIAGLGNPTLIGLMGDVFGIFNIPVFGAITLGNILLIPIMFLILLVILKIVRG